MFSMMLEIDNICNLNCKYCYLGDKKNKYMSKDTALKAVNLALREASKQKDKTAAFTFLGGEPLLYFDFIKELVPIINHKATTNNINANYSVTTNSLLLNDEIVDFLVENNFSLRVSIDGDKSVNDLNRVYYDGKGSYDDVINKLQYIRSFEKKSGKLVQAANVITKNNYKSYFKSFKHIVELGFSYIDIGVDCFSDWTIEDCNYIEEEIYKTFEYFSSISKKGRNIIWLPLEKSIGNHFAILPVYSCKAGIISTYITFEGKIFPCNEMDDSVCLGTVETGIDVKKARWLLSINSINNNKCNNCEIYNHCYAKGCIMKSLQFNHSFDKPVNILCHINKIMYKLIEEKFNINKLKALEMSRYEQKSKTI